LKIKKERKIKYIFYLIIIIFIAYNIMFLLSSTITKKDHMTLFRITFLSMENNLMEEDISKNDLVVVKKVKEKDLQQGDIIAYSINGQTRINKIINVQNGYTTKSNQNYYPDIEKIEFEQIIGKKIVNISFLGNLINILQSKITSIFILVFLLLSFSYNKYLFMKKKERAKKKSEKWTGSFFA